MQRYRLAEYQTTTGVPLAPSVRDELRRLVPSITITPSTGEDDRYDLTPGSWVGTVNLGTVGFEIRPKLPISRLLFLLSFVLDPKRWQDAPFDFKEEDSLYEAVIPAFIAHTRRALRPSVLQGYRREEDALLVVRGRLRFDEQVKRRYGRFPPVEVGFDEFTEDIVENRLLRAAIDRLRRLGPRSLAARQSLRAFDSALERVSLVTYDQRRLPDLRYTRLNARYRPAVELAKVVLRSSSFDIAEGAIHATTFLVDMNRVFEDFVLVALREELNLPTSTIEQGIQGALWLDTTSQVMLRPDISIWNSRQCTFVGDVKYKRIQAEGILHPDLYQLLAYCVATQLDTGLLIYAAGEVDHPVVHTIRHLGHQIEIRTLELAGEPTQILAQIATLARRIEDLQREAQLAA